ncbi:DUF6603 domain-containing protein [Streptomyces tsukubensis]|uniref:DUF6603 domain-containing protein n=1 Tax=Streptomyces tsukubensis TaxID=83656 RepID=A0A1V4A551_9ACTN|nr:DUF6603 domain-containing protein [Streptomyces tsukubensis]OON76198.1 hypothetical protein B1H18_21490 [Streptomyces tsukubensis]QFR93721.1 hypothetical protein GBW32_12305 [Streptomyces tsukubensis]
MSDDRAPYPRVPLADLTDDDLEKKLNDLKDGTTALDSLVEEKAAPESVVGLKLAGASMKKTKIGKDPDGYVLWGKIQKPLLPEGTSRSFKELTASVVLVVATGLDPGKPTRRECVIVVDAVVNMDLQQLKFSADTSISISLRSGYLLITSTPLNTEKDGALNSINEALSGDAFQGVKKLPYPPKDHPWNPGVRVGGRVDLSDREFALSLGLAPASSGKEGRAAEDAPAEPVAGHSWIVLNGAYLPGVSADKSPLKKATSAAVKITADLTLGRDGLELSILDTGFRVPLPGGDLEAVFGGGGLAFPPVNSVGGKDAAVRLLGAFLYDNEAVRQGYEFKLDGIVMITAPFAALQAAGSYAKFKGNDKAREFESFFVFASAKDFKVPLGPVTWQGLMLGGGMNSYMRFPKVTEVTKSPFLTYLGQEGIEGVNDAAGVLKKLCGTESGDAAWVTPKQGENWAALGGEFSIADLIKGKLLLIGEWGHELDLAVMATGALDFPKKTKTCHAELQVLGQYRQKELWSVAAALSDKSFVWDKAAKLTGGLALTSWTGGEHAGDCVFTIGGYSPNWKVPDHYPDIPRVGASIEKWGLTFRLELYFALLSHAVMLGGSVSIVQDLGFARWWLKGHLDFWDDWAGGNAARVDLGVTVGVSATIPLVFFSIDVSAEIGIDLSMWWVHAGHGGTWSVNLWVFSFGGPWGVPFPKEKDAVSFDQFKQQLPAPLKTTPKKGLQPDAHHTGPPPPADSAGSDPVDKYSTDGFTFETDASGPIGTLKVNGTTWPLAGDATYDLPQMGAAGADMTSVHCLDVYRVVSGSPKPYDIGGGEEGHHWKLEQVETNRSLSLFQPTGAKISPKDPKQVEKYFTGVRVTAPPPASSGPRITVDAGQLESWPVRLLDPPGNNVLPAKRLVGEGPRAESGAARKDIAADLIDPRVSTVRQRLAEELVQLGVGAPQGLDTDLHALAAAVTDMWTDAPWIDRGLGRRVEHAA